MASVLGYGCISSIYISFQVLSHIAFRCMPASTLGFLVGVDLIDFVVVLIHQSDFAMIIAEIIVIIVEIFCETKRLKKMVDISMCDFRPGYPSCNTRSLTFYLIAIVLFSYLSQSLRYSLSKYAWPWPRPLGYIKIKCKYANRISIHDLLFDGNCNFYHIYQHFEDIHC